MFILYAYLYNFDNLFCFMSTSDTITEVSPLFSILRTEIVCSDVLLKASDEGTWRGDTFCFDPFVSHVIGYIEVVKSLKEIFSNALPVIVIAILLDLRPIPGIYPKK